MLFDEKSRPVGAATRLVFGISLATLACSGPLDGSSDEGGELLGESVEAMNGQILFRADGPCSQVERNKVIAGIIKAREVLFSRDMRVCLQEHNLSGTWGDSPEAIMRRMSENKRTEVECLELPGTVEARAPDYTSYELVRFDHGFLATASTNRIASVALHEIAHNKGYNHGLDDQVLSAEWDFFVNEQLEACALGIASTTRSGDLGVGPTAPANGPLKGEMDRGARLAPAGGIGGLPITTSAGSNRFARGFYGHVNGRINGLGLFTGDRNGNAQELEPEIGSTNGSAFFLDCGNGKLMTGMDGWHGSFMNLVLPHCRTPTEIRNRSSHFTWPGEAGTLVGDYFWRMCPYGQAVKRMYLRSDDGNPDVEPAQVGINRMELECEHIDFGQRQGVQALGAVGRNAGTTWQDRCPVGTVMRGLFGRGDSRVSRLGATCKQYDVITQSSGERVIDLVGQEAAAILEGRGVFEGTAWEGDRCSFDRALVGLEMNTSSSGSIQRIAGICADGTDWSNSRVATVGTSVLGPYGGPATGTTTTRMCDRGYFLNGWDIRADHEVQRIVPYCVRAED